MSFKTGTKVRIRSDIATIQQDGYAHGYFITARMHRMAGEVVTIRVESVYNGVYLLEETNDLGFDETWLQPVKLIKRRKQC
jgi:hypothetical protein